MKLTWLAPSKDQTTREFLQSVFELTQAFPERVVATAIPMGENRELTMLHIVAGTQEGDLVQFSEATIRQFETLAAQVIATLSQTELQAAQRALEAREIGALSGASGDELAVVVGTPDVGAVQERIAALPWE